jgi:DNA-binding NarL/FixJ family response regulator
MTPIRILIVDDHPMMREALRSAILAEPDMLVAGEAANGDQAVQRYVHLHPDVVIMDLALPGRDGVQATADILALAPDARILALTSLSEDRKVLEALRAGALGYLTKDASRDRILEGVRQVANGQPFLSSDEAARLVRALRAGNPPAGGAGQPEPLTPREREVLALAADGMTNPQIAARLHVSEGTVRAHFHNITAKLDLQDRNHAVVWFWRRKSQR